MCYCLSTCLPAAVWVHTMRQCLYACTSKLIVSMTGKTELTMLLLLWMLRVAGTPIQNDLSGNSAACFWYEIKRGVQLFRAACASPAHQEELSAAQHLLLSKQMLCACGGAACLCHHMMLVSMLNPHHSPGQVSGACPDRSLLIPPFASHGVQPTTQNTCTFSISLHCNPLKGPTPEWRCKCGAI